MKTILSIYENLSMGGVPAVMRQRARWTNGLARNVFYYQNDRGGLKAMNSIANLDVYVGVQNHQLNIEHLASHYRPDKVFLYSHYHLASILRNYCSDVYFEYHRSDNASVTSLGKYVRAAKQVNVPTKWSERFVRQHVPDLTEATPIKVIPNVIDTAALEAPWSEARLPTGRHFLWVGQFGEHKNLADALRIFAGIVATHDSNSYLHVVLSREWTKDSVRDTLNDALVMGIFDRLQLYNDLEPPQVARLMKAAAASEGLNIVTSKRESYGLSIAESRAFGLVSLAADVGAIGEHVEDGVSGLLFPFGDVATAIAQAGNYLADKPLRERLKRGMHDQLEADRIVMEQAREMLS